MLLDLFGGLPPMRENRSANPFLIEESFSADTGKNSNGKRETDKGEEANQNKKNKPIHEPAEIKDLLPAKISDYFHQFKVNFDKPLRNGKVSLIKSALAP
jgi:hypothetical protein